MSYVSRGRGRSGGGFRGGGGRSHGSRGRSPWTQVGPGQGGRGQGGNNARINCLATLKGHGKTVSSVACSLKRSQLFSGSNDGTIRIWGWSDGNFGEQGVLQVGMPVNSLMVEDDWLVAGIGETGKANLVRVWNMATNSQQDLVGHDGPVYAVAQGGGMLLTAGHDALVRCWQMEPENMQFVLRGALEGHKAPVHTLEVGGTMLFSCARDNTIKQWDLSTGQGVCSITTQHSEFMMGLRLHDAFLFSAGLDGQVIVYNTSNNLEVTYKHVVTDKERKPSGVTAFEICTDAAGNAILVVACTDNALKLWELPRFDRRGILLQHTQPCRSICLGPGNSFFTAGMDNTIKVWEFDPGQAGPHADGGRGFEGFGEFPSSLRYNPP